MFKRLLAITAVIAAFTPPRATALDLTTAGASGSVTANDFFQQVSPQPTGTGFIDSFVRIQNTGQEQGYNTDGTPQLDTKAGAFTHSIQVSSLQAFNTNGTTTGTPLYFRFLLDLNQLKSSPLINLDQLQLFLSSNPSLTDYSTVTAAFPTVDATKIYDLDSAGNATVNMDYSLNSGSGSGDVFFYVKKSLFGSDLTKYVYLYSDFSQANDGFEEWAASTGTPGVPFGVPEPSTVALALAGLGTLGLAGLRRYRRMGKALA